MGDAKTGDANNPFAFDAARMKAAHEGPPMRDEHFLREATPLHKAAALLKFDEVDKLLAAGTHDVDAGDVLNQTALLLLARNLTPRQGCRITSVIMLDFELAFSIRKYVIFNTINSGCRRFVFMIVERRQRHDRTLQ